MELESLCLLPSPQKMLAQSFPGERPISPQEQITEQLLEFARMKTDNRSTFAFENDSAKQVNRQSGHIICSEAVQH
jgi:hypothetical protein